MRRSASGSAAAVSALRAGRLRFLQHSPLRHGSRRRRRLREWQGQGQERAAALGWPSRLREPRAQWCGGAQTAQSPDCEEEELDCRHANPDAARTRMRIEGTTKLTADCRLLLQRRFAQDPDAATLCSCRSVWYVTRSVQHTVPCLNRLYQCRCDLQRIPKVDVAVSARDSAGAHSCILPF